MIKNTKAKYGLWMFAQFIFIVPFIVLAGGTVTASNKEFVTATSSPQAEIFTVTPTLEANNAYFVVNNDGIRYTHLPTNGNSCHYLVSGTVTDLYRMPYLDFVVNIKTANTTKGTSEQPEGYGYPGTDFTATTSEPSGWLILLSQEPVTYEIWLTTKIGGDELSPHIRVPLHSCDQNQAVVNFVQVQALPGQTPSNVPIVTTLIPQETSAPFTVENNQISYTYSSNLGKPCYFEMAGRVLNQQGKPFTSFVVNIKMLGDLAPETPSYAFPGEGYAADGSSGWATVLESSPENYEVWLTTKIGGDELSPHIRVQMLDCVHNLARVNFAQIRRLS